MSRFFRGLSLYCSEKESYMTFSIVSNSSTAMCAIVENPPRRFFCHEEITNRRPIFLPLNYSMEKLMDDDLRVALAAQSFLTGRCTGENSYRILICASIMRPCSIINPPTASLICKSTCNYYDGDCPSAACNDKSSIVDDTVDKDVICAAEIPRYKDRSSSTKLTYTLVALVSLQVFALLAEVI